MQCQGTIPETIKYEEYTDPETQETKTRKLVLPAHPCIKEATCKAVDTEQVIYTVQDSLGQEHQGYSWVDVTSRYFCEGCAQFGTVKHLDGTTTQQPIRSL